MLALPAFAHAATITVNTDTDAGPADDGACTLREAITAAASDTASGAMGGECIAGTGAGDTVDFNIAPNGSGPHVISPTSALPQVTGSTTIDGLATDPDAIEIDGSSAGAGVNGLDLASGANTVRGLAVYSFTKSGITVGNIADTIEDSFIGTNSAGNPGVGNGEHGIRNSSVDGLVVQRNVISGNGTSGSFSGIFIAGTNVDGLQAKGNKIGTNPAGTLGIANSADGINFFSPGDNHVIGGPAAADANLISGNSGYGIRIVGGSGNPSENNTIQGNLIGTDATGTTPVPNALSGVIIDNDVQSSTLDDNVVSGNTQNGIHVTDFGASTPPTGNSFTANKIGVGPDGTTAVGNGREGIRLQDGANENTIGGTGAGDGNVIANNGAANAGPDDGVAIVDANTIENPILGNSIHSNGADFLDLGIDLGGDGVSPNDPGDGDVGPNNLQNFPVLTSAEAGSSTTVSGTLDSPAGNYRIEAFSNSVVDPSGNGEGETFLGGTTVTIDGSGAFSATVTGTAGVGDEVTATATRLAGSTPEDTSEFSASVTAGAAPPAPPAPTPDTSAPTADVSAKKKQRAKRPIKVKVGSSEAATAIGTGKVTARGGANRAIPNQAAQKRSKFRFRQAEKDVTAGGKVTLKLKVKGKRKLKRLVKLVRKGAKAKAKITVTLTDSAGNATSEKVKVKLK